MYSINNISVVDRQQ